jgi:hypothetical protein
MLKNETPTVLKGIVHGKTIELEQEPGLPEEQVVNVTVQPLAPEARRLPPGEGIRRSAGGWAEDAEELDEYLELVRQQRKVSRGELEP